MGGRVISVRFAQTDESAPTAPPANFRVDNVGEQNAELSWHAPPCEKMENGLA